MANQPASQAWLSTIEVAAMLGVTEETVRRAVDKHQLPHRFTDRGSMRIAADALQSFLGGRPGGDRWLSTGEVANRLGVSVATARRYVRSEGIAHIVLTTKLRVSEAALDAHLKARPRRDRVA